MATPICGFRAIDGSVWQMLPDCKRRNAEIYARNRRRSTEAEVIEADIASGEPIGRVTQKKIIISTMARPFDIRDGIGLCICGAIGAVLGVITVYVIDYFGRAL